MTVINGVQCPHCRAGQQIVSNDKGYHCAICLCAVDASYLLAAFARSPCPSPRTVDLHRRLTLGPEYD